MNTGSSERIHYLTSSYLAKSHLAWESTACLHIILFYIISNIKAWSDPRICKMKLEPLRLLPPLPPALKVSSWKSLFSLYECRGILNRACQGIRAESELQRHNKGDSTHPHTQWVLDPHTQDPWRNIISCSPME